MKPSVPLLGALVLVSFASCATTDAVCPRDTTTDLDVTIAQLTQPPIAAIPGATEDLASGGGTPLRRTWPVRVQYSVVVANRTSGPVRLKQISLEQPYLVGYRAEAQCFGLDTLGAVMEDTTRGFDQEIAPGGEARVIMQVKELPSGTAMVDPLIQAMTTRIRIETEKGIRSETLTRKVVLFGASHGARSQDGETR